MAWSLLEGCERKKDDDKYSDFDNPFDEGHTTEKLANHYQEVQKSMGSFMFGWLSIPIFSDYAEVQFLSVGGWVFQASVSILL